MAKLEGEWSTFLDFDGVNYWRQSNGNSNDKDCENYLDKIEKMEFTLPSDSTLRSDILLYRNGHEAFAQINKMQLEDRQRKDRLLRRAFKKLSQFYCK